MYVCLYVYEVLNSLAKERDKNTTDPTWCFYLKRTHYPFWGERAGSNCIVIEKLDCSKSACLEKMVVISPKGETTNLVGSTIGISFLLLLP
jgi:hypothetical protein